MWEKGVRKSQLSKDVIFVGRDESSEDVTFGCQRQIE